MTTHVVCLDGTGQTRTQANPTTISLMFDTMGGTIVDAENNSFESTLIYNNVPVQGANIWRASALMASSSLS
jgi:hypothetical protein